MFFGLMVENSKISRHDFVLEDGPWRDVDPLALVGDDDDCALENDSPAERHVAGDGKVIQLDDVGNARKARQKFADLNNKNCCT
jgi:hypothetical protein